jgi:hypothetical protein
MRRRLVLVIVVMACASGPDEADGVDETTTSTGASSSTSDGTTPGGTSSSGADTSGDPGSSGGSEASSGTDAASTGAPGDCAFAPTVAATLEDSPIEPTDCGAVTLADDVRAWQQARDCARDATLDQVPYMVLWQYDDGGTLRDAAFASVIGDVYAIYRFDDDVADGTTSITRTTCTGISTPAACPVMPGRICIECIEPSRPVELCE